MDSFCSSLRRRLHSFGTLCPWPILKIYLVGVASGVVLTVGVGGYFGSSYVNSRLNSMAVLHELKLSQTLAYQKAMELAASSYAAEGSRLRAQEELESEIAGTGATQTYGYGPVAAQLNRRV